MSTLWKPTADQSVWASASRSVRTPSRGDRQRSIIFAAIPLPFPRFSRIPVGVTSDPHTNSEVMNAYEIGYRSELTPQLIIDTTAFVHDYRNLIPGVESSAPGVSPRITRSGRSSTTTTRSASWPTRSTPCWRASRATRTCTPSARS